MTVTAVCATAEDTRALGRRLAAVLRAGDVVLLTGGLGAGKTTFTQGLAQGMGVGGRVTSPTFVLARVHPGVGGRPPLVHVDAYRLSGPDELDDLDLDADLGSSVTVVEWGGGTAEVLAAERLEVDLEPVAAAGPGGGTGEAADEVAVDDRAREVVLRAVGERWRGVDLPVRP